MLFHTSEEISALERPESGEEKQKRRSLYNVENYIHDL